MKFSATDWSFYAQAAEPERYYARLKVLGYDAVEMVDPARWAQARAAGLQILTLCGPGMELGLNRLDFHDDLIPRIQHAIENAGDGGIPYVVVFSGNRAGQSDAEGRDNVRRALEELLPDAESNNVTLLFEMLNTHDHRDYQADRSHYGFTLAREIDSPRLKVLYDIYHMERMREPALEDVPVNLPWIGHLHVAESPRRGGPRADGHIPYRQIVPAIMKAGYTGFWGMEFIPKKDSVVELDQARRLFLELAVP